ncbi:AgrD family cyclic lactone autoinducer peptide [Salinivirga cyanobacteriivorans]|uniref:AgrD family cyclic lactone autoinducer peptide n=1 Tax=Salinivirga cyanobacteriivorans TaxID=1307839 RepID=UPI0012FD7579
MFYAWYYPTHSGKHCAGSNFIGRKQSNTCCFWYFYRGNKICPFPVGMLCKNH